MLESRDAPDYPKVEELPFISLLKEQSKKHQTKDTNNLGVALQGCSPEHSEMEKV